MSLRARLEARREVAAKATPGPWEWDETLGELYGEGQFFEFYGETGFEHPLIICGKDFPKQPDRDYIAANDPMTITLMLDALRSAAQVQAIDRASDDAVPSGWWNAVADMYERLDLLSAHLEREAGDGD